MKLAAVVLSLFTLAILATPASASVVYAVTGGTEPRIESFDSASPSTILTAPKITGLAAGEAVQGIDLRPVTGELGALTIDASSVESYRTLDPGTGALGAPITLAPDPAFNVSGGVGVDFNPTADRFRIVTGAGQNVRIAPTTGAVFTDTALNPGTPQVAGVGYANSFAGATTTTLYDIDLAGNTLSIQNPPNNGTLTPVGALGITPDNAQDVGFDLTPANAAFLSARVGGVYRLYTVDLTTGAATLVGAIGDGATVVRDIALAENVFGLNPAVVPQHEGGGTATVTVERKSPHLGAHVDYTTVDASAIAGTDYDAQSGTLVFAPGEISKTITIPLKDDTAIEASKEFTVKLTGATADSGATATLPGPASATVSVTDDDTPYDRDGDGVPDATDTCPNVPDPSQADADHDGIGTACDLTEVVVLPDKTSPVVAAHAAEIRRSSLRRGVKVRLLCSEVCTVHARLGARGKTAATATAKLTKVGAGTLRLKPTKAGLRAIGKKVKLLKVALTAVDPAGNRGTYTFNLRIV